MNTALLGAQCNVGLREAHDDPALWGRLVESAVGAHLANAAALGECRVYYWRERGKEVDFVVERKGKLTAIEVKSGRAPRVHAGSVAFAEAFPGTRTLLVGGDGIGWKEFLSQPVTHWIA